MNSSLLRRLLLFSLPIWIAIALAAIWGIGESHRSRALSHRLERLERLADRLVASDDFGDPERLIERWYLPETRLTLHAADGTLLLASERSERPSLRSVDRPEIRQAIAHGRGSDRRPASADAPASLAFARRLGTTAIAARSDGPSADRSLPSVDEVPVGILRLVAVVDDIETETFAIRMRTAALMTIVSGVGLLQMFAAARSALTPLPRLIDFARRLARGEQDARLDLRTRREPWSSLGDAFDRMQLGLRSRDEALESYGQRLRTTLENMAEGVVATGRTGEVAFANPAAIRLLGISKAAPAGRSLPELVRFPELLAAVERSRRDEQSTKVEFETFGDPRRILAVRIDPIPEGFASEAVIVVRDVTELRHLETMRRDFVASVSHELKTPLAAIKAYAETLRLGALEDVEHRGRFVDEIEQQAERLHRLIVDLIQLAKIESEQEVIVPEPVDLSELIDEALGPFYGMARAKNLTLLADADGPVPALADPDGVVTIVDNLVSNAIRYTASGGRVDVRCGVDATGGWIEVEDTGIGIPPEHQSRVFERFYRVDRARSRELGGTGLGLAIVKHLVQAQRGTIELTSKVGVGTKLRITLPASPTRH